MGCHRREFVQIWFGIIVVIIITDNTLNNAVIADGDMVSCANDNGYKRIIHYVEALKLDYPYYLLGQWIIIWSNRIVIVVLWFSNMYVATELNDESFHKP